MKIVLIVFAFILIAFAFAGEVTEVTDDDEVELNEEQIEELTPEFEKMTDEEMNQVLANIDAEEGNKKLDYTTMTKQQKVSKLKKSKEFLKKLGKKIGKGTWSFIKDLSKDIYKGLHNHWRDKHIKEIPEEYKLEKSSSKGKKSKEKDSSAFKLGNTPFLFGILFLLQLYI